MNLNVDVDPNADQEHGNAIISTLEEDLAYMIDFIFDNAGSDSDANNSNNSTNNSSKSNTTTTNTTTNPNKHTNPTTHSAQHVMDGMLVEPPPDHIWPEIFTSKCGRDMFLQELDVKRERMTCLSYKGYNTMKLGFVIFLDKCLETM